MDTGDDATKTVPRSGGPGGPPTTGEPAPSPGERVDRYVVTGTLGSGGLGSVYEAYDPELDRHVALKLLKPQVASAHGTGSFQLRMLREAQAMAKLSHPNVVHVYDVGTHGEQVYIAMDRVRGDTLGRWAKDEQRTWTEIMDVALGAGRGLRAAHEAGLVHRDFKPSNVIVGRDGRAQVLDFGLARGDASNLSGSGSDLSDVLASGSSSDSLLEDPDASRISETSTTSGDIPLLAADLTEMGVILGTPRYMAPEQHERRSVDHRADQFSFCVTLFQLLARRHPFGGRAPRHILSAIKKGSVNKPAPEADVPRAVLNVIERGLAFDPRDRYADMGALLRALESVRGQPSTRRRIALPLAITALSLGSIATVAALLSSEPSSRAAERDAYADDARSAAAEGRYVFPPLHERGATTALDAIRKLEHLAAAEDEIAAALAVDLRREFAGNLVRFADEVDRAGDAELSAFVYGQALAFEPDNGYAASLAGSRGASLGERAADRVFSEDDLVLAEGLAIIHASAGDERIARLDALEDGGTLSPRLDEDTLVHLVGERAHELFAASEPSAASVDRAVPVTPPLAAVEPEPVVAGVHETPKAEVRVKRARKTARDMTTTGRRALASGNAKAAAEAFEAALAARPGHAPALAGLSDAMFERGDYEGALRYIKKACRSSPRNAAYQIKLGDAYFKVGDRGGAKAAYEKAKSLDHAKADSRLARLRG